MGLFLAVAGVVRASSHQVEDALKQYAFSNEGTFELLNHGVPGEPGIGGIKSEGPNTVAMYPEDFLDWDEASSAVSQILARPVFSFHIHDDDFWMYILFDSGREVDRFMPMPDYFGDVSKEEMQQCAGNAKTIAALVPDVSAERLSKYLVQWGWDQEDEAKANPEDEFAIGDCWQMCDFMNNIGFEYPMDESGYLTGSPFFLRVAESTSHASQIAEPQETKPWWKIW